MINQTDRFIPVVIAFDHNYLIPAGVCLTSLFCNANTDDRYRVFCLIDTDVTVKDKEEFNKLTTHFCRHEISYISMGDSFSEAYTYNRLTRSTYYRLMIPQLLPEYKKVIYADVDIIFFESLSDLYYRQDIEDMYLGVVKDAWMNLANPNHVANVGCAFGSYFNAGFLLMNIEQINKDHLADHFIELIKNKYTFHDQDTLNIACKGRVKYLSPAYNGQNLAGYSEESLLKLWSEQEIAENSRVLYHYIGPNPWQDNVSSPKHWWRYYFRLPLRDRELRKHSNVFCRQVIRSVKICIIQFLRRAMTRWIDLHKKNR